MSRSAAEVEELFERLATSGVTLLIQIDQSRLARGETPWIAVASGPGAPAAAVQVRDCESFDDCLDKILAALSQHRPT